MAKRKKKLPQSDCRIHLIDECRHIGTGRRGVQIIKRGRKWVRVRETSTGKTAKFPLAVFDRLVIREAT